MWFVASANVVTIRLRLHLCTPVLLLVQLTRQKHTDNYMRKRKNIYRALKEPVSVCSRSQEFKLLRSGLYIIYNNVLRKEDSLYA